MLYVKLKLIFLKKQFLDELLKNSDTNLEMDGFVSNQDEAFAISQFFFLSFIISIMFYVLVLILYILTYYMRRRYLFINEWTNFGRANRLHG